MTIFIPKICESNFNKYKSHTFDKVENIEHSLNRTNEPLVICIGNLNFKLHVMKVSNQNIPFSETLVYLQEDITNSYIERTSEKGKSILGKNKT